MAYSAILYKLAHYNPAKNLIIIALATSTKNADTSGRMINASGAGPYRFVTDDMLAIAVGVAPNVNPAKPALKTAAV